MHPHFSENRTKPGAGWRQLRPRSINQVWSLDILLVEDDAADASLILNVLHRHPKVRGAETISCPEVALTKLAATRKKPDLILLDLHMPKLNGFQFLEQMRRIQDMAFTPVVLLTTSGLASDVLNATRSSAALYVIKPDTYLELETRLDLVIRRALSGVWSKPS